MRSCYYILAVFLLTTTTCAQAPWLGTAWYPEQWPEARWDADLTLMQQAGFNVVRIGEFAWSSEEPSEGHYTPDWLDRAIAAAGRHGLRVVLCTPTDAPPAWLTTRYPETLGVNADGHRREHGGRRQFNYASPLYRRFSREIVAKLGQRFGHNPDVIGWQLGNEYTDESFDPATRAQFQQFLRAKYGTLANLNRHWSTAYWSQTYTAWDQIPLEATHGNPGLLLEHKHFVTATWLSFQQNQIDALRPLIAPGQFLTTNIGGLAWSDNWDHYRIAAPLTFASWDDYVGQGHLDPAKNAMLNDFVRGWKRRNFWVMETEPATVNWAPVNNALAPGETRALAWQTIGHGSDAVLYWQWRSAPGGQEQYHGTLVGPDGQPDPVYAEIARLGHDLSLTRAALAGTSPHATTALLYTYDSRWAIDFQPQSKLYDQQRVLLQFYTPLWQAAQGRGDSVDVLDPTMPGSLSQYTLLVAPDLNVLDGPLAAKLLAWVRAGGHLILGPRSGMKDSDNALNPERQPGPLAEALGAKVEQFYALASPVGLGDGGSASLWAEPLDLFSPETHVDLRFSGPAQGAAGWLSGKPAMVTRHIGRGALSYLGTVPDAATLAHLLDPSPDPEPQFHTGPGIEVCTRVSPQGRTVHIVLNHATQPAGIHLPRPLRDLLTPGSAAQPAFTLAPQQVLVLVP